MEYGVKRFARRVLLIHLALLVALLGLVALASAEVYRSAHAHALQQAQLRQTLLAEQTARGIQSLYESLLSDLELMHPVDPEDPDSAYSFRPLAEYRTPALTPRNAFPGQILSQQLEGRVSHLFVVDKAQLRPRWIGIGGD